MQKQLNIFSHAIDEHRCVLQVRGDKGVEKRLIANHMFSLRGKGNIGGKWTHNTRVEGCCRECSASTMHCVYDEFLRLDQLRLRSRSENVDIWVLHTFCMPSINKRMEQIISYIFSSEDGKTPKNMCC